jgi:signal peptidase II
VSDAARATEPGGALGGWTRVLAAAGAMVAVDQATKALAVAELQPGEPLNVFFGIDLNLVRNRGIAFGALEGVGATLIAALIGVALLGLLLYFARHPAMPWLWLPVGAVLGGAAGNLLDRAREGAVIDFIDPVFWPAFNLADAAIVIGVFGVLYVAEGPPEEEAER